MPSETELLWIAGMVAFVVIIHLLSLTPAWPRVMKMLGGPDPDYPKPQLAEGETVLREEPCEFTRGMHGGRVGRVVLTNHRIIWYENRKVLWPFKAIAGEFNLSEISSVDQGLVLAHIFGGRRLWIRRRHGQARALWVHGIDDWIAAINQQLSITGTRRSPEVGEGWSESLG